MEKDAKDTPKLPFAIDDRQLTIQTVDSMYSRLNDLSRSGNVPFIAEMIRRLLDRWALGDDPDPWLPFPSHFWFHNTYPESGLPHIGALRLNWASDDRLIKNTCSCGGYRYALGHGAWLTGGWTYYICIGCNTFDIMLSGGLLSMGERIRKSPSSAYQDARSEKKDQEPSDVINLIRVLGMIEQLQSLIKETPLNVRDDEDETDEE